MSRSIKFKDNTYIDSTGVISKSATNKTLAETMDRIDTLYLNTTDTPAKEEYYLIATLYNNGNGDSTMCRIFGTAGGYTLNTQASFDVTMTSRGVSGYGVWYGNVNAWSYFDIKMYKGTDNIYRVYFHRKNTTYHGNDSMFVFSAGGYTRPEIVKTPVTPNGTLAKTFDNSNSMTKIG